MPILVTCPACTKRFNAPDTAVGKKAKCPQCGGAIVISAAAAPPPVPPQPLPPVKQRRDLFSTSTPPAGPAFSDEDLELGPPVQIERKQKNCPICGETIMAEAVKCRFCGSLLDKVVAKSLGVATKKPSKGNWRTTRTGLSIIFGCTGIMLLVGILGTLIGIVLAVTGEFQPGGELRGFAAVLNAVGRIVTALGWLGIFVGQLMCITVPSNSGARGLAICTAIGVLLALFGIFAVIVTPQANVRNVLPLAVLGVFAAMIGQGLFVFFIRRCSVYLGDRDTASSVTGFFIYSVALLPVTIACFFGAIEMRSVWAVRIVLVSFLCGVYAGWFWYLQLIGSLMETIDNRARR